MGGNLYPEIIRLLRDAGWVFHREGKGSHEIWSDPVSGRKVTVPRTLRKTTSSCIADTSSELPLRRDV
jgi:predicted RNA binding protein YcfA (HicA-like mRNA interferase family)